MPDPSWALRRHNPTGWGRAGAGTPRAPWVDPRLSLLQEKWPYTPFSPTPPRTQGPSFMCIIIHASEHKPSPQADHPFLHHMACASVGDAHLSSYCPACVPGLLPLSRCPHSWSSSQSKAWGNISALLPGTSVEQDWGRWNPGLLAQNLCSNHLASPQPRPPSGNELRQTPSVIATPRGCYMCQALGTLVLIAALQGGYCRPILWLGTQHWDR